MPFIKYSAIIKVTNYCDLACRHCEEWSGPQAPKTFLPVDDILYYLSEFLKDPMFRKSVSFTGGEFLMAAKYHSITYITTLLQYCIDKGIEVDLKTNSKWALDKKLAPVIWDALENLNFKGDPMENYIQMSLSFDSLHNNVTANQAVMRHIIESPKLKGWIQLHFSSLGEYDAFDSNLSREFLENLGAEIISQGNYFYTIKDMWITFNREKTKTTGIRQTGRAIKYNLGKKYDLEEFKFMKTVGKERHINIHFHHDKTMYVTQCKDKHMRVSYVGKDGKTLPFSKLYPEMVRKILDAYKGKLITNPTSMAQSGIRMHNLLKTLGQNHMVEDIRS